MTVEVEKSQDRQLISWRPRRTEGVSSCLIPSLRSGEYQCPSSKIVRQRKEILPNSGVCSSKAFGDRMMRMDTKEVNPLYLVYRFKCQFHPEAPSETRQNI